MSLSIGWITFHLVALVYAFTRWIYHAFSLGLFVPISWLDTPLHFVVTYWTLWDMFIDHLFILHTYHELSTSSFV